MDDVGENQITIKDQIKKFALKSLIGYQTVLVYGLGYRLGIFDYLYKKGKKLEEINRISELNFSVDELSKELGLDFRYIDGWLHMGLECGLFEIDQSSKKTFKPVIFVYDILINRDNMFFIGGTLMGFYLSSLIQDIWFNNFKTGKLVNILTMPSEMIQIGQNICTTSGIRTEELFSTKFKDKKRALRQGGSILEVGCGYGYNLAIWAKKYKKAKIIGIDIDPKGLKQAKQMVEENNWNDRIQILEIKINEFANFYKEQFDLIMLNHVLHEINPDEIYRQQVLNDLYGLLKVDGILIVGEHIIPSIYEPKKEFNFFEIWHKWYETPANSVFYNEETFKALINKTLFEKADLIKERGDYFWALKK
ncbi:MAG: class I SAM-dependent methyltransferase [Candidatus Lokiarchaeota archaeon]|nr:class I SAM-dependent methyltransferase [Candidatus Lokiarchaeota archaeon]